MSKALHVAAGVTPSHDAPPGYRPALDGIRAVAVLAVIAYHLGYGQVRGGFLGVDTFFVLSGYLITSLLLAERARTGSIDFVAFWFRRARRLLPALFVMLVVVAVWIGAATPRFALEMRREDLLWTLFYGANWHFVATGQDYFAQLASASPLRHTWSLSIEEQFYVAWPLIVGASLWLGRRRPAVVAAICVAGAAASVAAMALLYNPGDPSRSYYGTDARAHQLLVGALLGVLLHAWGRSRVAVAAGRAAPAVALVAGLALLATFARLSDADAVYYRGVSVLIALGAGALIWGVEVAPRSIAARFLSLPPATWIGRISYGLYLWHWPVILAVTTAWGPFRLLPGSFAANGERVALTFVIATGSFYLLEQPIRKGTLPVLGPSVRRFAVAALVAVVAVAGTAYWQTRDASPQTGYRAVPDCPDYQICVRRQGPPNALVVAVVGDSIARSLDPGFADLAREHGWTYLLEAANGCRVSTLLTSAGGVVKPLYRRCHDEIPGLERKLLETWHPDLIVVIDREERVEATIDGRAVAAGTADFGRYSTQALVDFARMMTAGGSRLVFLELPPIVPADCLDLLRSDAPECRIEVDSDAITNQANAIFREAAARVTGASSISISDGICPSGECVPVVDGLVLRYDGNHFSAPAAEHLAPLLYGRLAEAGVLDFGPR